MEGANAQDEGLIPGEMRCGKLGIDEVGSREGHDDDDVGDEAAHRFVAVASDEPEEQRPEPAQVVALPAEDDALHQLRPVGKAVGMLVQALGTQCQGELAIRSNSDCVVSEPRLSVLRRPIRICMPVCFALVAESSRLVPWNMHEGRVVPRHIGKARLVV